MESLIPFANLFQCLPTLIFTFNPNPSCFGLVHFCTLSLVGDRKQQDNIFEREVFVLVKFPADLLWSYSSFGWIILVSQPSGKSNNYATRVTATSNIHQKSHTTNASLMDSNKMSCFGTEFRERTWLVYDGGTLLTTTCFIVLTFPHRLDVLTL